MHLSLHFLAGLLLGSFVAADDSLPLPKCFHKCTDDANIKCSASDLACICHAAGPLLPALSSCYQQNCAKDISFALLWSTLTPICLLAGSPLPAYSISTASTTSSSSGDNNNNNNHNGGNDNNNHSNKDNNGDHNHPSTVFVVITTLQNIQSVLVTPIPQSTTRTVIAQISQNGAMVTVAVPEVVDQSTTVFGLPVVVSDSEGNARPSPTTVLVVATGASSSASVVTAIVAPGDRSTSTSVLVVSPTGFAGVATAPATTAPATTAGNGAPFQGGTLGGAGRMAGSEILGVVGVLIGGAFLWL